MTYHPFALAGDPLNPTDSERIQARDFYAAGQRAFDAGRYTEALQNLELAYRTIHHPSVAFSIAVTMAYLNRPADALMRFQQYLTTAPNGPMAAQARNWVEKLSAPMPVVTPAAPQPTRSLPLPPPNYYRADTMRIWLITGAAAVGLVGLGWWLMRRGRRASTTVTANRRRRSRSLRSNSRTPSLDSQKIKRALADVHLAERTPTHKDGVSRSRAVADAIAAWRLNADEAAVLRRVTGTDVEPNRRRRRRSVRRNISKRVSWRKPGKHSGYRKNSRRWTHDTDLAEALYGLRRARAGLR